jgi:hypothetical protein
MVVLQEWRAVTDLIPGCLLRDPLLVGPGVAAHALIGRVLLTRQQTRLRVR